MGYTPENNPYIPGDPYSYDLKWMVDKINEWTDPLDSAERAEAAAVAAGQSEENAAEQAKEAEAWAIGTKNGVPVSSTDLQYLNNSKHWAEEASDLVDNVEDIQEEVRQDLADQNDAIDVLEGRMDAFTTLAEGSTTGDAELMDIRVGYNGYVWNTAGDAVRGQVDHIIDNTTWKLPGYVDTKDDYTWIIGGCNNYGGYVSSSTRIVNNNGNSVSLASEDIYVKSHDPNVYFYVYYRTEPTGIMTGSGWVQEFTINSGNYFRIIVHSDPEATIVDAATSTELAAMELNVIRQIEHFPKDYYPLKIVAKDGSAEYSTIQSAIDDANDGDVIYIKSGWYNENVVNTKQITLLGQDKYSTVIYNTTGSYAAPPLWTCSGKIENLTVYAYNENNVPIEGINPLGYALHLDQKWDVDPDRRHIEIRNCIFKSDFNDCIGCGMDANAYIEISDTICYATRRSGMKVHPFPTTGSSKLLLRNNVFVKGIDSNAYGLLFHTGGTDGEHYNTIEVEAYNNIAKTYNNFDSNCFIMSDYNYGNTLPNMNRFTLE